MKDQFYIVLPSNSSMSYFSDNTTTHFITRLPQHLTLCGSWVVALTEIQIPMTFQHIPFEHSERYVELTDDTQVYLSHVGLESDTLISSDARVMYNTSTTCEKNLSYVQPGVYKNIQSLVSEFNELQCLKNHLTFSINSTGYIKIISVCSETGCDSFKHEIKLSARLRKILGFDEKPIFIKKKDFMLGSRPANLCNGLPSVLMVYSDICEPIIIGDVQAPLLRSVSLGAFEYSYGSSRVKSFSPCMYIPLLTNSFSTIEIDIKDDLGQTILFDGGTLTATLHFKRLD